MAAADTTLSLGLIPITLETDTVPHICTFPGNLSDSGISVANQGTVSVIIAAGVTGSIVNDNPSAMNQSPGEIAVAQGESVVLPRMAGFRYVSPGGAGRLRIAGAGNNTSNGVGPTAAGQTSANATLTTIATQTAGLGTSADAAVPSGAGTLIGLVRALRDLLGNLSTLGQKVSASSQPVVVASDQSAVPMTSQGLMVTGPAGLSAINTDLLTGTTGSAVGDGWYDTQGKYSASISVISTGSPSAGAVVVEGSNDLTNPFTYSLVSSATSSGASQGSHNIVTSGTTTWTVGLEARYVRVRISTAIVGGTVQCVAWLRPTPLKTITTSAIQGVGSPGSAVAGNPVLLGLEARTSFYTAISSGLLARLISTVTGVQITRPYSIPEAEWSYTTGASPITGTTSTAMKASAGAGIKNYINGFQFKNTSATASTINILQGSTVIWSGDAPASMTTMQSVTFPTPLQSASNAAINVQMGTTGTSTIVNAQGYSAP